MCASFHTHDHEGGGRGWRGGGDLDIYLFADNSVVTPYLLWMEVMEPCRHQPYADAAVPCFTLKTYALE